MFSFIRDDELSRLHLKMQHRPQRILQNLLLAQTLQRLQNHPHRKISLIIQEASEITAILTAIVKNDRKN
jgi:hypothetical protein